MHPTDLSQKQIVIWGTGREGQATAAFLDAHGQKVAPVVIDEATPSLAQHSGGDQTKVIRDPTGIAHALEQADVIIKSPGVSLYHPLLAGAKKKVRR